jgi:LysR family cyn operon transcriptional activator
MELRHLRYFVALAEELSFTRAAQKVHITQSTLSQQIRRLEDEIGHPLFDRVGKRVIMTEIGQILLTNATKALREIDDGLRAIKGFPGPLTGELRIASTHTFSISLIPDCIAAFLERHPSASVMVQELQAGEIEAELAASTIDLGVAYFPTNRRELIFEPLYLEEMVLAVSDAHPFAHRKRVRLAELHRQHLVVSPKDSRSRQMLEDSFRSVGAEPIMAVELCSTAAMLNLVRRTKIAAIVSERAAVQFPGIRVISIESPTPQRTPGILWRRNSSKTLHSISFAGILRRKVLERDEIRASTYLTR